MKWYQKSYFWGNLHFWDLKEGKESLKFMTVVFTLVTYKGLLLDMYNFEKSAYHTDSSYSQIPRTRSRTLSPTHQTAHTGSK